MVAVQGPEALYSGSLSSAFIQQIASHGGVIAATDLKNYQVQVSNDVNETKFSGACHNLVIKTIYCMHISQHIKLYFPKILFKPH